MFSISTPFQPLLFKLERNSSPKHYKPFDPEFSLCLRTRKTSFLGGILTQKIGLRDRSRTMIQTSVLKDSRDGDDAIQVIEVEQEGLIDGSTRVQNFESTLNRLSKWLVSALFGGVILWRHDAEALWMAMGSIVNALLSVALKRVLNQERPVAGLKSDPGMPSSHAQSIFFTVVFAIVSILEWLGVNELSVSISVLALAFGSYFSWLRASQKLHTINQILVGAVVGLVFSVLWYISWDAVVLEAFNSSLLVRVTVLLACAGFGLGFLLYVIQYWFKDER
ncbi:Lipid phosphate phosphatase epsilon 2 [Hibiscus syriacus]|uniref:Lipid phosphate phosphatase epsilon 2 n=1 Tax=Hibiscus syriacus TaxID=106335 RepID=A0A6A2Z1T8_HIBSY|nr:lipid phosphate phosphatase epsilon 2, chloroplastic-like [Hibiscus syriacus]KAE8685400.1 Lipid phosphate phosphatase epsilon 2 [Hibiscus syriacus]